ncbi:Exodeoxyribonuclease I [Serratia symbiotica]|nr:Exodeoxyribonuclease I [Serratia symbiotica]
MDRPAQFAGVRTDMNFRIIEEPLVIYCAPADDYLPDPEAVMITGITPQLARAKGINEADFARKIHQAFSMPGTCILGYNNIRFDDEVSRNIFYRNFYDPYTYSWKNGNSRWDLLNVMRAFYALAPDGIVWPKNEAGSPSFRLEHLTRANEIEHAHAHDAMSDVYATLALATQVKEAQPRLFDLLLQFRKKKKLNNLINIPQGTPLVHVSSLFGAARSNTSWVVPLAWHPLNKNLVIMCDLAGDLTPLLTLNAYQLRKRLYTRRDALTLDQLPIPLQIVHINKCPVLVPANTLLPENAERLGINRLVCLKNLHLLRKNPQLREKIVALFAEIEPFKYSNDVDARLYDGFFSQSDKAAIKIIQQTKPQNLATLDLVFTDKRIKELLFRFRARNYPNTLDNTERKCWLAYRQSVLSEERVKKYLLKLGKLYNHYEGDNKKTALLNPLFDYAHELASKAAETHLLFL